VQKRSYSRSTTALAGAAVLVSGLLGTAGPGLLAGAATASAGMVPQAQTIPNLAALTTATPDANTDCTLPDGSLVDFFHCYTPQQIRSAYGVDQLGTNYGAGQTIVLVDSYGSPTAAADLATFHNTFFPTLPAPHFQEIYPLGNPQYSNSNGKGKSGSNGAAGWSGEATLDIEWSYAIAPEANIVLLAVPPAETEGVQGFPNLFKAISGEIGATPPGTVFSMSFSATEQTLGGAAEAQTAKFDAVFQQGLAKDDNFFVATGDNGTYNAAKQQKNTVSYQYPTVGWPGTSPYVVAVGGTQLQSGWRWNPASNAAFDASGDPNPAYWQSTTGGSALNTVWNESWAPIGTGGGVSTIYPRPSWQAGVATAYGNGRLVPDTSWNAAVNGGVDVYITAYPQYNCSNSSGCWAVYGGTSAATPQTAALVALANAARAGEGKSPIGFLDPILYSGLGASAYNDVTPVHEGTAPPVFNGTDLTPAPTPVTKSVGDLIDNQMWGIPVAGYPTTSGYDLTTGWGTPNAAAFVSYLAAMA
jgi:subtilase family serine protease